MTVGAYEDLYLLQLGGQFLSAVKGLIQSMHAATSTVKGYQWLHAQRGLKRGVGGYEWQIKSTTNNVSFQTTEMI